MLKSCDPCPLVGEKRGVCVAIHQIVAVVSEQFEMAILGYSRMGHKVVPIDRFKIKLIQVKAVLVVIASI